MPALQELLGVVARRVDIFASRHHTELPDFAVTADKEQRLLHSPWFASVRIELHIPMKSDERRREVAQELSKMLAGRGPMIGIEPDWLVARFAVANGTDLAQQMAWDFAEAAQTALDGHAPDITAADIVSYRPSALLHDLRHDLPPEVSPDSDTVLPVDFQP